MLHYKNKLQTCHIISHLFYVSSSVPGIPLNEQWTYRGLLSIIKFLTHFSEINEIKTKCFKNAKRLFLSDLQTVQYFYKLSLATVNPNQQQ